MHLVAQLPIWISAATRHRFWPATSTADSSGNDSDATITPDLAKLRSVALGYHGIDLPVHSVERLPLGSTFEILNELDLQIDLCDDVAASASERGGHSIHRPTADTPRDSPIARCLC